MKKEVKNWLETAHKLLDARSYIYTIFMCHLAIEKILKAKVEEITGKTPPKTHNLRHLVRLSGLEPPEEIFGYLSKLTDVSIPTRYPEDFAEVKRSYNKNAAESYFKHAKEAFNWIRKSLKP